MVNEKIVFSPERCEKSRLERIKAIKCQTEIYVLTIERVFLLFSISLAIPGKTCSKASSDSVSGCDHCWFNKQIEVKSLDGSENENRLEAKHTQIGGDLFKRYLFVLSPAHDFSNLKSFPEKSLRIKRQP